MLTLSHSPSLASGRRKGEDEDGAHHGPFSSVVPKGVVRDRAEGGLGVLRLNMDEMLLLTECPRMVDMEPSVSDDIVDRGRGMYSTLSENSTRGLDDGRVGESAMDGLSNCTLVGVTAVDERSPGCSKGVLGRLLLNRGCASGGDMKWLNSCPDMAVDRRCRWPGLAVVEMAVDGVNSVLPGLELMTPDTPFPPTSSLTCRL